MTAQLPTALPRAERRQQLGIDEAQLPFDGADLWRAWELSWLDGRQKPQIALASFLFPCASPCLIESKSLKLYLHSLHGRSFSHQREVRELLESELTRLAGARVTVRLAYCDSIGSLWRPLPVAGRCLDELPVQMEEYGVQPQTQWLRIGTPEQEAASPEEQAQTQQQEVEETLYTQLLRCRCPLSGHPDWGCIQLSYTGAKIHEEGLLKYILSYREHESFHEDCIERMYMDILQHCRPRLLALRGFYLRRGGLDINPMRSNHGAAASRLRLLRQ